MAKKKLSETPITNTLAEKRKADGRRSIQLTSDERKALQLRRSAEKAAMLFLNIDERKKWPEIAEEMGMSLHQLKELVKTPEFDEAYNSLFPHIGHDPRYKAAQAAVTDMVPVALRRLHELLISVNTPASVTMKAIEKILDMAHVEAVEGEQYSQAALIQLLQKNNVHIENVNIEIPTEYQEGLTRWLPETVEASVQELSDEDVRENEQSEVSDLD